MKHSFPKPTARDLLADIVAKFDALNAMGDLGDCPTDILNDLDAGETGAREALEWLSSRERPNMSRREWTGENSYPRVL